MMNVGCSYTHVRSFHLQKLQKFQTGRSDGSTFYTRWYTFLFYRFASYSARPKRQWTFLEVFFFFYYNICTGHFYEMSQSVCMFSVKEYSSSRMCLVHYYVQIKKSNRCFISDINATDIFFFHNLFNNVKSMLMSNSFYIIT